MPPNCRYPGCAKLCDSRRISQACRPAERPRIPVPRIGSLSTADESRVRIVTASGTGFPVALLLRRTATVTSSPFSSLHRQARTHSRWPQRTLQMRKRTDARGKCQHERAPRLARWRRVRDDQTRGGAEGPTAALQADELVLWKREQFSRRGHAACRRALKARPATMVPFGVVRATTVHLSSDAPCAIGPTPSAADPRVGSTTTDRATTMVIARRRTSAILNLTGHNVCHAGAVRLRCR